ncbi:hypothetical protein QFZ48_003389 [Chitinophaga sp. W2I13]|uniref:hypothetical protein n=1 Tax=Chitinophaga sp. W2I13 TaxID=3373923 RepID=UPI003D2487C1
MKYIILPAIVLIILSTTGCRKKDQPNGPAGPTGPAPLQITRLLTSIYRDNILYEQLDYNNNQLVTFHHYEPTGGAGNMRLEFKTDADGKLTGTVLYRKDGANFKLAEKNTIQSFEKELKITGSLYPPFTGIKDTIPDTMRFGFDDNGRLIQLTDTLTTEKGTDYLRQLIAITTYNYSGDQLSGLTRNGYGYYASPTLPGGEENKLQITSEFQFEYDNTPNFFYALGKKYPYLRLIMKPDHPLFAGRFNVKKHLGKHISPGSQTEITHLFQDTRDDLNGHIIYTTEVTIQNGVTSTTQWQYHYRLLP